MSIAPAHIIKTTCTRFVVLAGCALMALPTASAEKFSTTADYAYIMDAETGIELYSKRGQEAFIPASMTKIMTAYMVFDRVRSGRLEWDETFKVSENAWRKGGAASGGSTMFLDPGSEVAVEDLVRGVIIQSGNDACIVLAEGISGSEEAFATEMTARAKELGLESANFLNATGLPDPGHEISAADLAKLAYLVITDFPEYYGIYSETGFEWNGIKQPNRNPLLDKVDGADGLKTGYTDASGYGLVGSAERDGERRIIVLNGLTSKSERASEARRVMRSAFRDFATVEIAKADVVVAEAEVWMGLEDRVPLKTTRADTRVMHADELRLLDVFVEYQGPVKAPIAEGQEIGALVAQSPGMEDIRIPLVATQAVEKKGLLARAMMGIGLGD